MAHNLPDRVLGTPLLRALFLTHHAPWPTFSGGRLRDAQLVPRLLAQAQIDLVAVTRTLVVDGKAAARVRLPGLAMHLYPDSSVPGPAPMRASPAACRALTRLASLRSFEVVHVEGHYLLHLLPDELSARSLLVEHNIESTLLEQRARLGDAAVSERDVIAVRRREEKAWRSVGGVVTLTDEDAAQIRERVPGASVYVVPNGWDHLPLREAHDETAEAGYRRWRERPRLLFMANFGYAPNVDAATWLVEEIFPRIRSALPRARLVLAGPHLPTHLRKCAEECPGVEVAGWVPSATDELDRADVALSPMRIGGGIKVKVTEALRRGRPLVSTSIGVHGIPPALRAAISIADDPAGLAARVVELCRDDDLRRARLRQVRAAQTLMPSWDTAAARIVELWMRLAGKAADGERDERALPGPVPASG